LIGEHPANSRVSSTPMHSTSRPVGSSPQEYADLATVRPPLSLNRLSRFDGSLDLRMMASPLNDAGVYSCRNSMAIMATNPYPGSPIWLYTPVYAAITRQTLPI
jgi:hypothetical protein